ncbi:cell envelope integrity protein CreD [Sphingobacterium deserti]|uniref:Inner membrane CreD family protein n=1 Tax=Sphingobacterium deserti TaxID=1229276 RepID=A0A0B8T6I2_9SPHI|nr:cell envelope integrity protein CreD [Sphingobacterium deserti]KGE13654.1 inner membrane CreD family protein [Sphingobacterium deserti]
MGNEQQQTTPPLPSQRLSVFEKLARSAAAKLMTIFFLVILLLIPMEWLHSLIGERRDRERQVSQEIASKWGQSQVISGPILGVPYTRKQVEKKVDDAGKAKTAEFIEKDYVFLTANKTAFSAEVSPQYLKRGIYQTVTYNAQLKLKGNFDEIDFSKLDVHPEDLDWDHAKLFIGVSDLKGLTSSPHLEWGSEKKQFEMGNGEVALFERTMVSEIALPDKSTMGEFAIDLAVRGSRSLTFFPTARESVIDVSGAWSSPSFNGGFLPEKRTVNADSFAANWSIPSFGRKIPQQWMAAREILYQAPVGTASDYTDAVSADYIAYSDGTTEMVSAPAVTGSSLQKSSMQDMVQINFLESVNNYQKTTRVAKYGILVILLTFTALFFTEIIKKQRVHIVQYILIGAAMVLFYSLLLAIGEHLGFNWSYLISSVATIALIASFIYAITKARTISVVFSMILALFYAFIYLLMQLQDFSLIVGTIGVFIILAILMRLSTRVNWNNFGNS